MTKTLCMMAGAAILLAGTSGLALAQYQTYSYQPGYAPGYAQPAPAYGYAQPGYAAAPGCGRWRAYRAFRMEGTSRPPRPASTQTTPLKARTVAGPNRPDSHPAGGR